MGVEWRSAKIEEVAEKVAMGPFGSSIKVETFVPSGVPVISGQHLHGWKVDDRVGFNFITEAHAEILNNANVQRGDVIFTHAGNIGQVAYVPPASQYERYIISQRQFYMRCNRSKVLPEFVVAYFKTPEGRHQLLANTSQTGVPSIAQPVTYLRTIEIPLPPLPEQRAIAYVLNTLDDKIEINRNQSETLEAIARALFKSWFIDFDPVRLKMEGRWERNRSLPGLPAHLYGVFPDSLMDSEFGEIPEDWGFVPMTQLIDLNPPRSLRKGEVAPYLDMANMPTRGHAPDEVVERPFGSGMRFVNGDTLLARITPCLENGKAAFVDFLDNGQVGWGSTEYIVLRSKPPLPPEFAYCLARSDAFREFAILNMTGTSGRQRVQADSLAHFKLPRVPKPIAEMFGQVIRPLFGRAAAAIWQSRTLATLRDTLLPKLVSGDLRIKDAERIIGGRI